MARRCSPLLLCENFLYEFKTARTGRSRRRRDGFAFREERSSGRDDAKQFSRELAGYREGSCFRSVIVRVGQPHSRAIERSHEFYKLYNLKHERDADQ